MISKTKIDERLKRKTNPEIVETVILAKKHKSWHNIAAKLSAPKMNYISLNLNDLDKIAKEGDIIIVPGKVLGSGSVSKKIRICALGFSASAREKVKAHKGETVTILEEIRKNPKGEGIKVI